MSMGGQSVEAAMEYLQEVEKELPERDFAEFLNIIEDFKSNRCGVRAPGRLSPAQAARCSARGARGARGARSCPVPSRAAARPPPSAHHASPWCCRGSRSRVRSALRVLLRRSCRRVRPA